MKKIIVVLVLVTTYLVLGNIGEKQVIIPKEAIRMRVIPNSNKEYDQDIKQKVSINLQNTMYSLLKDTKGVDDARNIIEENLPKIDNNIKSLLKKEQYNPNYRVNFGYNYFPSKTYKGITYDEGLYESVVVTLGEGKGDNWWCVLFPPLCLLEAEESTNVEYKWYIKELIDKYI